MKNQKYQNVDKFQNPIEKSHKEAKWIPQKNTLFYFLSRQNPLFIFIIFVTFQDKPITSIETKSYP
jgi:hypothetical protein